MIESVTVRDLGVIVNAEVEFDRGLTVITGETGAGKTMLLTGLGLLWGERADPGRVRSGCEKAQVDGVVRVRESQLRDRVQSILDETGGEWDDDAIVISRTVYAEGRSRAHLGGRVVPAGALSELAGHVVAVHGQDDQMRLRSARHQRDALDAFGGSELAAALASYQALYADLKADVQLRATLGKDADSRAREATDLRSVLALIDEVQPKAGEAGALRHEAERLANVDRISQALDSAWALLRERDSRDLTSQVSGVEESLAQARTLLDAVASHDPQISSLVARLDEVGTLLADVIVDLARVIESTDADPARLEFIESRRASLSALRRRVAAVSGREDLDEDGVVDWADIARVRLAELDDDPASLAELDRRIEVKRSAAGQAAARLSQFRVEAGERLSSLVTEELANLAMPRSQLLVSVTPRPAGEGLVLQIGDTVTSADRYGADDVCFLLADRESGEPRPITKGASGGERSRIMLALEVVLAATNPVPTMVFDEVDAGVGGRAAVEVGRRLSRLAQHAQVLVVTHLPQVAAFADVHLVVRADARGQVTHTSVETVEGEARQRELARMLAGLEDSTTAMAHAQELLEMAAVDKDTPTKRRRQAAGR